jgi:pimeloyl-ACP methyl ester carboxylesterase
MINFNIDDKLDNIKCKTFVIGSNNDEIFWSGPSNNIAKKLNCKLYLYDDYGHWVYDEAPDYRKRILEFLNEE